MYSHQQFSYQEPAKYPSYQNWSDRYVKFSKDRSSLSNSEKIQEIFLNHCRKNYIPIEVTGLNNLKLTGLVVAFDQTSLVIETAGWQVLFYKSQVFSIKPQEKVDFLFKGDYRDKESSVASRN